MAARAWVFTLNNYSPEEEASVQALAVTYLVYGRERGEEGTPHLQGLVYHTLMRLSAVKKLIPRAHWEAVKGTIMQAEQYCEKDGDVFRKGTRPSQGKRNDIEEVRLNLRAGVTMRVITDTAPSYQAVRMAEVWLRYNEAPRDWLPEVYWYWGPPGSGKTRAVYAAAPEVYSVPSSPQLKWWDGYDAHEDVLIDDFRGDHCDFARFLKLIDRYEFRVECKGGMRQLLPKRIFITSCVPPWRCWSTNENLLQIKRRLHEIKSFHMVPINGWHTSASVPIADPLDA